MADLTRFWIVPIQRDGSPPQPTRIAATYRVESVSPEPSTRAHVYKRLELGPCEARTSEGVSFHAASPLELLDKLAPRHGGLTVQLEAPLAMLATWLGYALGVEDAADLEPPRNLVLDWPTRDDAGLRCAIVGLDLDWAPPPPPHRAARFPGGPGSAATRRQ